jgi:hypothetical protein
MISAYAYTGIYVQDGAEWLVGTPVDFPEAFAGHDWEWLQVTEADQQTAQKLMEDASPEGATVIVKIFHTWDARDAWLRSAKATGFV